MTLIDPIFGIPTKVPPLDGFGYAPFPDAQPFSQRTASGYQESLEYIIMYLQRRLYPYLVQTNPQGQWDANATALVDAVNAALTAQTVDNAQRIADALDQLVHSSITITDPAILVVLQKADSATRQWINANVVTPDTVLATFTKTGSSFKAQLDEKYDSGVRTDFSKVLALNVVVAPAPKGNAQDDTSALMAVIAPLHAVGGTVLLQRGLYYANLDLAPQFAQVRIVGQGMWATEIRSFKTGATDATVKFNGGSGNVGGGGIEECTISSADNMNNTGRGVVFSGTTGCHAKHVRIRGSFAIAVLFWNERQGDFTEFNTVESCDIAGAYRPVSYYVTNGVESFHGSGLIGTTINVPGDFIGPVIDIMDGALPYNAPLSFATWFHTGQDMWLISLGAQSGAGRHRSFYGTITVENNSGVPNSPTCRGSGVLFYAGKVSWLGPGTTKLGAMYLCTKIAYEAGTVWGELLPFSTGIICQANSKLLIGNLEASAITLVAVHVQGPNYEYHGMLMVQQSQFNGSDGFVIEVGHTQLFDPNNIGGPVFAYNAGLYIGNPNYTNAFSAYATASSMGGSVRHNLLAQA